MTKTGKRTPANRGNGQARPGKLTAAEQRNTILNMFFDGDDANSFIALAKHCRIDLAACDGEVKQVPNVIAAHYRVAQGRYDIDRAACDLATFPPVAARIAELKARKLASGFGRSR